ncbi:MAG TPA: hypothetical protein VGR97_04100 [Candidatus Acidoferrales bacterium]|nr:hypothetical protein [Candidatus Acidoferrales bacterium]
MAAGTLSALLTIFFLNTTRLGLFMGAVFGVIIAASLVLSGTLRIAAALQFAAVAAVAYFVSFLASFGAQLALGSLGLLTEAEAGTMSTPGAASPAALLVGGLVGGFLIIGDVLLLAGGRKQATSSVTLLWSVASAALAFTGWALAPSLGVALLHLVHRLHLEGTWPNPQGDVQGIGAAPVIYSVHFVWQIGMAFVIGFVVSRYTPVSELKGLQP